ncbi:hypothetical protein C0993_003955 [Termitomyces sp. T159_Od127]|nr:hypothetical protein C0993_003955 [Termitomyces sp. T159_Od127]
MPTQESAGSSSGQFDSETRIPHIHFPVEEASPSRQIHRPIDAAVSRVLSPAAKTLPIRRISTLTPRLPASQRRVRSLGTPPDISQDSTLNHKQFANVALTPPRVTASHLRRRFETMDHDNIEQSIIPDEYDLSHEDPQILQDVQRALKLKARREARLHSQATPVRSNSSSPKPHAGHTMTMQFMTPISPNSRREGSSSDIDFSPSTRTALLHPVPASLDNGMTLDWSSSDDKHESKWRFNGTKRKGKEALPPSAVVREQQETAYADKLCHLKSISSPQTIKKAKMTRDQLERRYNLIFGMLPTGRCLNNAKIVRWYGKQDVSTRSTFERTEPFTWLKHLENRDNKSMDRSIWFISALIAEEYLRTNNQHESVATIPKHDPFREGFHEPPASPPFIHSQLASVTSRISLNDFPGRPYVRKSTFEDRLTFQPRINSARTSLEVDTRRSHDSSLSSLPVGSSLNLPASPTKRSGKPQEVPSQPIPISLDLPVSQSMEHFRLDESDHGDSGNQKSPKRSPDMNIKVVGISDELEEVPNGTGITLQLTAPPPSNADVAKSQSVPSPAHSRPAISSRLRTHVSLPSADRTPKSSEAQQQREADEQKAYDAKVRLLEQMITTNHRVRQLLNRISGDIREYDAVQSNAMATLGVAHLGLPRELVDAFGHDPAAVTGATRRFQGWRAVEDIQRRLVRQNDVFRSFLSCTQNQLPRTKSVLDDPISSLMESLQALELHGQMIAGRALEVGESLKTLQATHDAVKANYNKTLARTSVVYPEVRRKSLALKF